MFRSKNIIRPTNYLESTGQSGLPAPIALCLALLLVFEGNFNQLVAQGQLPQGQLPVRSVEFSEILKQIGSDQIVVRRLPPIDALIGQPRRFSGYLPARPLLPVVDESQLPTTQNLVNFAIQPVAYEQPVNDELPANEVADKLPEVGSSRKLLTLEDYRDELEQEASRILSTELDTTRKQEIEELVAAGRRFIENARGHAERASAAQ